MLQIHGDLDHERACHLDLILSGSIPRPPSSQEHQGASHYRHQTDSEQIAFDRQQ